MNPRELDDAVRTLRSATPRREAAEAARLRLGGPRRSRRWVYVVAGVAVVGAWASWPRSGGHTMALAQVIEKTEQSDYRHAVTLNKNGEVMTEMWLGPKGGHSIDYEDGKIVEEQIRDQVQYFDFDRSQLIPGVNARPTAVVFPCVAVTTRPPWNIRSYIRPDVAVVSTRVVGDLTEYIVGPKEDRWRLRAETSTGRITEIEQGDSKVVTRMDYPPSIPDELFDPLKPRVKGVSVHMVVQENATLLVQMEKGLGKNKGVTLHGLMLDGPGHLYALWTGAPCDVGATHPVEYSVRSDSAWVPLAEFSSVPISKTRPQRLRIEGQVVKCMGRTPKEILGKSLPWLRIWTPNGKATFRNVPITRIGNIDQLFRLLPPRT